MGPTVPYPKGYMRYPILGLQLSIKTMRTQLARTWPAISRSSSLYKLIEERCFSVRRHSVGYVLRRSLKEIGSKWASEKTCFGLQL